jgi:hypothetical protein
MAYYFKIGLLVRTEDNTKFLVCEKSPEFDTDEYILPGGLLTESSEEDCLKNEIEEELDCQIDMPSLEYVETYTGPAAGHTDRDITIKLYTGNLIGVPAPVRRNRVSPLDRKR